MFADIAAGEFVAKLTFPPASVSETRIEEPIQQLEAVTAADLPDILEENPLADIDDGWCTYLHIPIIPTYTYSIPIIPIIPTIPTVYLQYT